MDMCTIFQSITSDKYDILNMHKHLMVKNNIE